MQSRVQGGFWDLLRQRRKGIDGFHGLHRPNNPHINGSDSFRATTYGNDAMVIEPDLGLRPWMSDDCAKAGTLVATGRGALSEIKLDEDGANRPAVSGFGLT